MASWLRFSWNTRHRDLARNNILYQPLEKHGGDTNKKTRDQIAILGFCSIMMFGCIILSYIFLNFFVAYNYRKLKLMGFNATYFDHWLYYYMYILIFSEFMMLIIYLISLMCKSSLKRQWIAIIMLNIIYILFFLAEILLLNDMKVHIIDMDLLNHHGILSTALREIKKAKKGEFLPPNYGWYVMQSLLSTLIIAFCINLYVKLYANCIKKCLKYYHLTILIIIIFSIFYISCISSYNLTPFGLQFDSTSWPFNFLCYYVSLGIYGNNEFIHIGNNDKYPEISDLNITKCELNTTSSLNLYNIVILTHETWPKRDWNDKLLSHHLRLFIDIISNQHNSHNCIEFDNHLSVSRVTEMSTFALFYSIYQIYLESFTKNYVKSYPIQILRKCYNYNTAYFSASAPWLYPNTFLLDGNFDFVSRNYGDTMTDSDLWPKMESFLNDTKKTINKKFYIHYHAYCRNDKYIQNILNISRGNVVTKNSQKYMRKINIDENKLIFLQILLNKFNNMLNETLFVITNDHGNRDHNDGDNWHSSRVNSPLILCIPNSIKFNNFSKIYTDTTTHIDIMPTILELFGIHKHLNVSSSYYSQGIPIYINNNNYLGNNYKIKQREFVYFIPRFFPKKSKILAVHHINTKRTLHFIVIAVKNNQFKYRYLWLWDKNNNLLCDQQQLMHSNSMECNKSVWDQALSNFNTKEVFRTFLN